MIKHVYTEPSEINFNKLENRLLSDINEYNIEKTKQFLSCIIKDEKPTLIMATGGSKVVAYYLKNILEKNKIICEVIEPRDFYYKPNINCFHNLVIISRSGKTNGIEYAINNFNGNIFMISEDSKRSDIEVLNWKSHDEEEKSFISLETSLAPCLLLSSLSSKEMLKNLIKLSQENISKLTSFNKASLIEIISGYDTLTEAYILESNLVEAGVLPVIIHDKSSYCHGRSNTKFNNPNSYIIYLLHEYRELDNLLLNLLKQEYSNIYEFTSTDIDPIYKDYYLMLNMYYLSKKIADDKNIDITQPNYNENIVRKIYKYKGDM